MTVPKVEETDPTKQGLKQKEQARREAKWEGSKRPIQQNKD